MYRIIGITGNANSGKDTTADYIISKNPKYKKISFADPLKKMLIDYFGLTYQDVYTTVGKNKYNQFWNMTNRQILQKVGTDALRKGFCYDTWVKITQQILLKNLNNYYIIADVRFNNEAEMIKKHGGIVIKINRNQMIKQNTHESEIPISNNYIDLEINNHSSFYDLYENINKNSKYFI